jgi:hypothetical protein
MIQINIVNGLGGYLLINNIINIENNKIIALEALAGSINNIVHNMGKKRL